tara:strand:+ start:2788 stop:3414 length:627 start_codon:yes stop_codon:yes gene_type:complete
MSDNEETNEVFEEKVAAVVEEAEAVAVAKPEKKKKAKRVISDAERERLRANLAKGRATSLANRKKKAQLRKIKKEEDSKADDEKIFEALKKKLKPKELEGENASLKKQLEILQNEMKSMREAKATPAPKTKLIQVVETPQLIERPVKERKKKVQTAETEDSDDEVIETEEPPPPPKKKKQVKFAKKAPTPPAKKELSKRDIMKMMRGL